MRSKLSNIFNGLHLDYGINDGHVTKKLFGHKNPKDLYVADVNYQITSNNQCIGENFLSIDIATSKIENESSTFDSVSCMHVIEHVPNISPLIIELNRQLKRGGLLYIEAPNNRSLWVPSLTKNRTWNFYDDPTHIRPYTENSLIRILEANGFKVLKSGIARDLKYALAFPFSIFVSLILRDIRPIFYSTIHFVGWSSYVLCEKV